MLLQWGDRTSARWVQKSSSSPPPTFYIVVKYLASPEPAVFHTRFTLLLHPLLLETAAEANGSVHDMLHVGHDRIAQRSDADPWQRGGIGQRSVGATLAIQADRGRRNDLLFAAGAHAGTMLRGKRNGPRFRTKYSNNSVVYTVQPRYAESEGDEKTLIYRGIRYTKIRFTEVISVLLRCVEIHNNVYDYLF